jgi:hypothetical protein
MEPVFMFVKLLYMYFFAYVIIVSSHIIIVLQSGGWARG